MTKRSIQPIQSDRVRLRPLQENDLPMTLRWRNQDQIRKWFFHSNVIAPEQHRVWFDQYTQRDDDFVFIIEETSSLNRPVGQVALYHIDWMANRAEFGRLMIGESEARGKGLAHAATQLLVDSALTDWGLTEVYLEVFADNAAAIAIYRACGFQFDESHDNILTMWKRSR